MIIDEVHNLINGYINHSKNALAIYNLIHDSECKVLALTGTPIYAKLIEWALLANLLKPGSFPDLVDSDYQINKSVFYDYFECDKKGFPILVDGKLKIIKPKQLFETMQGIISYVHSTGGVADYPEKIVHEPIKVQMSSKQQTVYNSAYQSERDILDLGKPELPRVRTPQSMAKYKFDTQMYIMAKQHIMSKKASNFYYPDDPEMYMEVKRGQVKKLLKDIAEDQFTPEIVPGTGDARGMVKIVKPDLPAPDGWITRERFAEGQLKKLYSPKMAAVFDNILSNFGAKHVVYTFFKSHSGVNVMRSILQMCGVRSENYSGDLNDRERTRLLAEFNSPKNRYGDRIKVLFVTDAGKEGISLLEVGHLHILESDERGNKIKQIEGRVVRFGSHTKMPQELQRVHVWRYWSMSGPLTVQVEQVNPQGEMVKIDGIIPGHPSIDEQLHLESFNKIAVVEAFEKLMIEHAIEYTQ